MKVSEIISENLNELTIPKSLNPFKKKPKGLEPSSPRAREYKDQLKANRAEAIKKLAKKNAKARQRAESRIKGFPGIVQEGIHLFVSSWVAVEYWTTIEHIEEEYEKFLRGEPSIYDDMSTSEALAAATKDRNEAVGGAVIAAFLMFKAPERVIKALGWFASKTPVIGTAIKIGGALTPTAVKKVFSKFSGIGSTAALAFMATDAGQEFMKHWIGQFITGTIGIITTGLIDSAVKGLEAAGIKVWDSVKSPIQQPPSEVPKSSGGLGPQNVPGMKVNKDTKNPKIISVGGVQITGDDGFILPGMEQQAKYVSDRARALGIPDPLAGVKSKP